MQAGIEGENADRVERIVRRQLSELKRGRLDLSELHAAKASVRAGMLTMFDSPSRILGFFQERQAAGARGTFADELDRLAQVRRDDVARAARTVKLDTVFLLTGNGAK